MRVFVTGATGAVGQHLVPRLVRAGHQVIATTRTPGKAGRLRDPDRLFAATNELRIRGTDNLLAAAAEAGTRRVIAQSYTGWPNERSGGKVKNEEDPLDSQPIPSA